MSATSLAAEVCSEFCSSPNSNAPADLCMQSYDTCQHLKENVIQNRVKFLNGKLTESAVFSEGRVAGTSHLILFLD